MPSIDDIAEYCFTRIQEQTKRPLFVGVGGDSGSGKSYLVALLIKRFTATGLPYSLINHDDFLISRADREPMKNKYYTEGKFAGKSYWEVLENMFRLDEYQKVIHDLKSGEPTAYYPYSRETGKISSALRKVEPEDFIIFDTSMMLGEMDFVILVDVTLSNIIQRKLARDSDIRTPEQIEEMHRKVQGYYWIDRGRPTDADIIIDNNNFSDVKIIKG